MKRRMFSLLMALCMVFTMLPVPAFAAEATCGIEEHGHNDGCYGPKLICGLTEHTHGTECEKEIGTLTCTLPSPHTHGESCGGNEDGTPACGLIQAHVHTDACADCGYETACEHATDECYNISTGTGCGVEAHTHGDGCYSETETELTCGKTEHDHGDGCYAPECSCEIFCAESMDSDCPVCGADGAVMEDCKGPTQTYLDVLALFAALPRAVEVTETITEDTHAAWTKQAQEALAAMEQLSMAEVTALQETEHFNNAAALWSALEGVTPVPAADHECINGEFTSLAEALAASYTLTNGNYCLPETSISVSPEVGTQITVPENAKVTLCLAGRTLSLGEVPITVEAGGSLTICDCTGNGFIKKKNTVINNAGILRITGGTVECTESGNYVIRNSGSLTVDGGTVTGIYGIRNATSASSVTVISGLVSSRNSAAIYNAGPGSVTVEGGRVYTSVSRCIYNEKNGDITIKGGSVECGGSNPGIYNEAGGTVLVENGTVSSKGHYGIQNNKDYFFDGTVIVKGGTVTGGDTGIYNYTSGSVSVEGGTVTGTRYYGIGNRETGNITVSGTGIVRSANGTGIYTAGTGTITVSENARVEGLKGHGINLYRNAVLNVTGGQVIGNGENGHGIQNSKGSVRISGGSIASELGYGVYTQSELYLSGSPAISGNETTCADLYANAENLIYAHQLDDADSSFSPINTVTVAVDNTAVALGDTVIRDVADTNKTKFSLINSGDYSLAADEAGTNLVLAEKPDHIHQWNTEAWDANENGHWHPCTADGCTVNDFSQVTESGYTAHTAPDDDEDCTTAVDCDACKYVFTAAKQHTYDNNCDPSCNNTGCTATRSAPHDLKKTEANPVACLAAGNSAYWTCETCGWFFSDAQGNTRIDEDSWIIPASGHNFAGGTWVTTDEDEHWKKCASCDVEDTENKADHSFVNWISDNAETHTATCTCGKTKTVEHTIVQGDCECGYKETYTVIWADEDGTTVLEKDENVAYGTAPTYDGQAPAKEADAQYTYTFKGWSPEITEDTAVTGNVTYRATYEAVLRSYTVTWIGHDGTSVLEEDKTVAYGTTPIYDGETPTKPADADNTYTFKEWSPEIAPVDGNEIYTAQFTAASRVPAAGTGYTIDYADEEAEAAEGCEISLDGTQWSAGPLDITPGGSLRVREKAADDKPAGTALIITLPERPAVPAGVRVVPETAADKGDGKVTGITRAMEYRLTPKDGQPGRWIAGDGDDVTDLAAGTKAEVRIKAVTEGDSPSFAGVCAELVVPASDEKMTVTFSTARGTEPADQQVNYGGKATEPAALTATGYTFVDWYADSAFTTVFDFDDPIQTDTTVYAKWTINRYTITFDTDGGTAVAPITQDYGTPITEPDDPVKAGYFFDGWDKTIPAAMPAENMTITAQWDTVGYEIIEGAKLRVYKGNSATFVSNAPFSKFVGVLADGSFIERDKDYTAVPGSTEVTLKASYIRKLKNGEHTLTILSTDGWAETTFTVRTPILDSPRTGDTTNTGLWIALAAVGCIGLIGSLIGRKYLKKRK